MRTHRRPASPTCTPAAAAELRTSVAAAAARLIADQGLDLAGAIDRAIRLVTGASTLPAGAYPDAAAVDTALRAHFARHAPEVQSRELALLRRIAGLLLDALAAFSPRVGGAVAAGTANRHSDIWLYLDSNDSKNAAIMLANAGIEVFAEPLDADGEALCFIWRGELPATAEALTLAAEARTMLGTDAGVVLALVDPRSAGYRTAIDAKALRNAGNSAENNQPGAIKTLQDYEKMSKF